MDKTQHEHSFKKADEVIIQFLICFDYTMKVKQTGSTTFQQRWKSGVFSKAKISLVKVKI
ncbi:MAG: hypothetical protein HFE78_00470 [Clostridiales bacterium]|nr:hypothetical protein [Clostridiales bacterium]